MRTRSLTKGKLMELAEDPHLIASNSLAGTVTPAGDSARLPKIPLRLNGQPFDLRSQPPGIGEGSRDIYRALGYSEAELEALAARGVIQLGS